MLQLHSFPVHPLIAFSIAFGIEFHKILLLKANAYKVCDLVLVLLICFPILNNSS